MPVLYRYLVAFCVDGDSDDDQSTANLFLLCRYLMYIEADAWATNLKQKLACGSVLMSAKMEYYEFFTRALQPNVHYVEVSTSDMCQDTARKVSAGFLLPHSCLRCTLEQWPLLVLMQALRDHLLCTGR